MKIQQDARVLVQGHDLTRQHATPLPPKLLRPLFNQFARPSGLLGRLAGRIMAKSDRTGTVGGLNGARLRSDSTRSCMAARIERRVQPVTDHVRGYDRQRDSQAREDG